MLLKLLIFCLFQDLLTGNNCCIDVMGSVKGSTRANWEKKCCYREPDQHLALPPPKNISAQDKAGINDQIKRMGDVSPSMKQVSYSTKIPLHKITSLMFLVSMVFGIMAVGIFSVNIVICFVHPIWFLLVKNSPRLRRLLDKFLKNDINANVAETIGEKVASIYKITKNHVKSTPPCDFDDSQESNSPTESSC